MFTSGGKLARIFLGFFVCVEALLGGKDKFNLPGKNCIDAQSASTSVSAFAVEQSYWESI